MKRIFIIVALLGATASVADRPSEADRIMQLEKDWIKAMQNKDAKALDKILAKNWHGQGSMGEADRDKLMQDVTASSLTEIKMGKMDVVILGDGKVAVCTGSDDEKSTYNGKDTSGHWLWMDVFEKQDGMWKAVRSQNTWIK